MALVRIVGKILRGDRNVILKLFLIYLGIQHGAACAHPGKSKLEVNSHINLKHWRNIQTFEMTILGSSDSSVLLSGSHVLSGRKGVGRDFCQKDIDNQDQPRQRWFRVTGASTQKNREGTCIQDFVHDTFISNFLDQLFVLTRFSQ